MYSVLDNAKAERATGQRMPHWTQAVERHLAECAAAPAPVASDCKEAS
jgi:dTDP-4-dehydrorhamnose reductase